MVEPAGLSGGTGTFLSPLSMCYLLFSVTAQVSYTQLRVKKNRINKIKFILKLKFQSIQPKHVRYLD